ncbi:DUF1471 domain-containing protein [Utexia brackfieldae]|uniref:YdgH/BhsA/McbA-like domain containing protein n=1 Tax=Utexia brackfieldae TaxID=3074108 RepID=UPI00370D39E9
MVSLKKTMITVGLLSILSSAPLFAATELTQQQANQLQPFKEISIQGHYYSFAQAARDISRLADKQGATGFYIKSMNSHSSNEMLSIVYADLYKADAPEKPSEDSVSSFEQFEGVYVYPKKVAIGFEPFDILKLRGSYLNQRAVDTSVAKAAAEKGAYAFYIDRQIEVKGSNTEITAYLFKKDAAVRQIQPEDAIPYDSEAGRQALAQGGAAALQVEKPGYYSSSAFNEEAYTEKFAQNNTALSTSATITTAGVEPTSETNSGQVVASADAPAVVRPAAPQTTAVVPAPSSSRYSVTVSDGRKIDELNNATAAKMVPFDSIKFRGNFNSDREITRQAAQRAVDKGAKYYHITRIAQATKGSMRTVYVDLFK